VGYEQAGGRVRLLIEDGRVVEGDCAVGADGVHSRLRQQMAGEGKSEFMGIIAWRGLAPRDKLSPELQRLVGTNWVGPGGHVITYPLRGGEILNFVGFGERADWTVESWTTPGTKEECAADFRDWHPLVHEIIENVDQPYKWALVGRAPLQTWTDGAVTLMGDACHPTLPFLAQGAIMAIEDGFVLARCLDAEGDIESALLRFQNARVKRTTDIVLGSTAAGKRFHNPVLADPKAALSYVEREWTPEKTRTRYDWLFEYDATTAPI
jgi:salicylate hydroxylase